MARMFKRDRRGRFARGGSAGGKKGPAKNKKTLKQRYQKGHTGAGAIHRRRRDQWNSGRKRDKAKVLYKSSFNYGGGAVIQGVSMVRNNRVNKKASKARSNGFAS